MLSQDSTGEPDYTMREDAEGVWITVDKYSLYIGRRAGGTIKVEAYHFLREMGMPLHEFTLPPKIKENPGPEAKAQGVDPFTIEHVKLLERTSEYRDIER